MSFENESLRLSVSPDFQIQDMELKEEFEGAFSLTGAAEMHAVLRGVLQSLSFLLMEAP
jgi:hypothetical protein